MQNRVTERCFIRCPPGSPVSRNFILINNSQVDWLMNLNLTSRKLGTLIETRSEILGVQLFQDWEEKPSLGRSFLIAERIKKSVINNVFLIFGSVFCLAGEKVSGRCIAVLVYPIRTNPIFSSIET